MFILVVSPYELAHEDHVRSTLTCLPGLSDWVELCWRGVHLNYSSRFRRVYRPHQLTHNLDNKTLHARPSVTVLDAEGNASAAAPLTVRRRLHSR